MPLVVRTVGEHDWPSIEGMQRECFPAGALEDREILRSLWTHSPGSCLIAEEDGPLGYLLAHPWPADDFPPAKAVLPEIPPGAASLFIHDLAVIPRARGRQVGRRLVDEVLGWARGQGLGRSSLVSVQGSGRFWEQFGFRPRADLTARFAEVFRASYGLEIVFMTMDL